MKTLLVKAALGVGLLAAASAYAEAPAGATAECKDGTSYSGTTHKGACRGHQGVKSWLNASSTAAADTSADTSAPKKSKKSKSAAAEPAATTAAGSASAAGHTALCKDGTYYDGTSHKGACKGHKGVKEWTDTKSASTAAASAAPAPAPAPAAAPAPAPAAAPAPAPAPAAKATAEHKAPTPASEITQKAGGGPGLVWVNSESKVYHCQGDEWYGKTKQGSYMTEAAAKTEGDHAAHGKECGK
jgi:hypothetical protein